MARLSVSCEINNHITVNFTSHILLSGSGHRKTQYFTSYNTLMHKHTTEQLFPN